MINKYEVYTAECDRCGKNLYDVTLEEATSMSELESALIQEGWEFVRGKECLCDRCK